MTLVAWKPEFKLGIAAVDHEHEELIGLLNDVIRQCSVTQQILVHMSEERRKRKIKVSG